MPSNYSTKRSVRGRKIVAAQLPAPCTVCKGIVTTDHRWQADHIMQRSLALAAGWTEQMIDDASNFGAAHASCNAKKNKRVTQTKAERVAKRIPKVQRPTFENLKVDDVFFDEPQYPVPCHPETLSDCGQEATE